jgi:hypothetical protein
LNDEYSVDAEEKPARDHRRRKLKSDCRERQSTEEKLPQANRHEDVFPEGVSMDDCTCHSSRVMRRLENGQVVFVADHVSKVAEGSSDDSRHTGTF